ncbi:hypothetical protein LSUCC0387_05500 [Rhodobacterales bacterium LSUCC0387]|nr:hypothetical protein [Rhodobacterales bacterium LSUCC0387]
MPHPNGNIYIDPSYPAFNNDKLFDLNDVVLNRDDQLMPFHRLRMALRERGQSIHTADLLLTKNIGASEAASYVSLGIIDNFSQIQEEGRAKLKAFVLMEPPVVAPHLYKMLPELTEAFELVYLHNVDGDGYDLTGVKREKLRRLYLPIPYHKVLEPFWSNQQRANRVVVINGNHKPKSVQSELYSTRIEVMSVLAAAEVVDLYGRGWERWWSRAALWLPYWTNRKTLMSIYKGSIPSKFEVLQRYRFCLCFENMAMKGYITEKLFDCLYSGTIPLYLGAPDIECYVPEDVYIDCRKFQSWEDVWKYASGLPTDKIEAMREAGRHFLESELARPFVDSLTNLVDEFSV